MDRVDPVRPAQFWRLVALMCLSGLTIFAGKLLLPAMMCPVPADILTEEQLKLTAPGPFGPGMTMKFCFDFWINRYQTMIGAGVALLAGYLALIGAKGQIQVANKQLPMIGQQTEAIRAEQISNIIAATIRLDEKMTVIFERLNKIFFIMRDINSVMKVDGPVANVVLALNMTVSQTEDIDQKFDDIDAIIDVITSDFVDLYQKRAAAYVNPSLEYALKACTDLDRSFFYYKSSVYCMKKIFHGTAAQITAHSCNAMLYDREFRGSNDIAIPARVEMRPSVENMRKQLRAITASMLDK
ncbi:hypothetical protein [Methylobacterium oryzae]|uniref:hypothetical protein n=1 Tax=Methylobacterium oryzae TaxID=334852 RepID=UPI001F16A6D8|nr:hypothetical protein [Methylobacterium oryzae]UIN33978.1 hypothetical protein LXM90_23310 [Methylobacterium oryzae]